MQRKSPQNGFWIFGLKILQRRTGAKPPPTPQRPGRSQVVRAQTNAQSLAQEQKLLNDVRAARGIPAAVSAVARDPGRFR